MNSKFSSNITQNLLYEIDVVQEKFDAQEKIKRYIWFFPLGILFPSIWGHFRQFGIGVNEEELIICV